MTKLAALLTAAALALPACATTDPFFERLSPWHLVLYLANGSLVTIEVETLEQCMRVGRTLIAVDPARFSVKDPVCMPYQQVDKPRPD